MPPVRGRHFSCKSFVLLVPGRGLEPLWDCGLRILSPLRLPISPSGLRNGRGQERTARSAPLHRPVHTRTSLHSNCKESGGDREKVFSACCPLEARRLPVIATGRPTALAGDIDAELPSNARCAGKASGIRLTTEKFHEKADAWLWNDRYAGHARISRGFSAACQA
jgi:hypothetical protein